MQLENKGNIYNTDTTFCMVKVLVRCMLLSIHFHTTNNENNKTHLFCMLSCYMALEPMEKKLILQYTMSVSSCET